MCRFILTFSTSSLHCLCVTLITSVAAGGGCCGGFALGLIALVSGGLLHEGGPLGDGAPDTGLGATLVGLLQVAGKRGRIAV